MSYTLTLKALQEHTLNILKQHQKAFNKHPTSINWHLLTRSMLTYQQAVMLNKDANVQHLLERLPTLTMGEWEQAIVQHALGMSIEQALA
jgi:hypothetical protein